MSTSVIPTVVLGCQQCRTAPATREELALEGIRTLYSDSHEGYALYRCRDCGQIFLEQFHEILDWTHGRDDIWQRWTPLTTEESVEVDVLYPEETEDYGDVPYLAGIMRRRGRLTRDPEGTYYWNEEGSDAGDLLPPG